MSNGRYNVVHLATTNTGGAGIAAWRQHLALLGSGVDSRFLCARADPETVSGTCAECSPLNPPSWRRALCRLLRRNDALAQDEAALAAVERSARGRLHYELFSSPRSRYAPELHAWIAAADVVHLHWTTGFLDYPRFFSALKSPLVWTLHDQNPYLGGFHYSLDRDRNPDLQALDDGHRELKRRALGSVRSLVVVGNSTWNTSAARESGLFPSHTRYETIYYPLDTTRLNRRDKSAAKRALGLPENRLIVGFASTSLRNTRKGLATLLDALRTIEASTPLALLSFGSGPEDAVKKSLQSPWHHLGYLENDDLKAAAYSAMDCFVIPSHAEAFGQTAIEAQACGTPVVGSDVGGIREALDNGRCGLLFPAGDVAALAARIRASLTDRQSVSELTENALRQVAARHAPETCARAYHALYDELAAGARGRS